jgi:hypothetical protein
MPESAISSSSELATLPRTSVNQLCDTTINVARQIDGMMRLLVKEQGYARITFDVVRGKLGILRIERSFRMIED